MKNDEERPFRFYFYCSEKGILGLELQPGYYNSSEPAGGYFLGFLLIIRIIHTAYKLFYGIIKSEIMARRMEISTAIAQTKSIGGLCVFFERTANAYLLT